MPSSRPADPARAETAIARPSRPAADPHREIPEKPVPVRAGRTAVQYVPLMTKNEPRITPAGFEFYAEAVVGRALGRLRAR